MSIQQTTSHCCGQQMSRLYPIEIKEYPILGIFLGSKFIPIVRGSFMQNLHYFDNIYKNIDTKQNKKDLNNCYSIYY